jgi:nicotinate phosphoribosyltransferase
MIGVVTKAARSEPATREAAAREAAAREPSSGTALLTDLYELTMVEAALISGAAHRRCVF